MRPSRPRPLPPPCSVMSSNSYSHLLTFCSESLILVSVLCPCRGQARHPEPSLAPRRGWKNARNGQVLDEALRAPAAQPPMLPHGPAARSHASRPNEQPEILRTPVTTHARGHLALTARGALDSDPRSPGLDSRGCPAPRSECATEEGAGACGRECQGGVRVHLLRQNVLEMGQRPARVYLYKRQTHEWTENPREHAFVGGSGSNSGVRGRETSGYPPARLSQVAASSFYLSPRPEASARGPTPTGHWHGRRGAAGREEGEWPSPWPGLVSRPGYGSGGCRGPGSPRPCLGQRRLCSSLAPRGRSGRAPQATLGAPSWLLRARGFPGCFRRIREGHWEAQAWGVAPHNPLLPAVLPHPQ